ncbi:MAG: FTR1 family protein [Betaproteobacteria bacterium]
MSAAALIVFREVLEAALVIGIILAASRGVTNRGLIATSGIAAGLLGSFAVALLVEALAEGASEARAEILNAAILGAAVSMLGWHNVWMRRQGREATAQLQSLSSGITGGRIPSWVLGCAIALVVLREGSETALFLYGIAATGERAGPLFLGSVVGLAGGMTVGLMMYAGVLVIPARHFFNVTGVMILFLCAGLASDAAGHLVQAGTIPPLYDSLWDTSRLLDQGSLIGQCLHALIGYASKPAGVQVLVYLATLAVVGTAMFAATRHSRHLPR